MGDVYVEWMLKRRPSKVFKGLKALCIVLLVGASVGFLTTFNIFLMLAVVALAIATSYASSFTKVEYEYIYVNGEMAVDRILAQSKRKRLVIYDFSKVEIIAPLGSPQLDGFAHKQYAQVDYTSGVRTPGSHIYVMYYAEGQKVLLEPSRELMEAIKKHIPHKAHIEM